MADSYSWLNLSMRLRFCAGATKVHKIILVAINASIYIVLSIVTIQDGHSKGRG